MGAPTQGPSTGTRALNRRVRMKGGVAQAMADLRAAQADTDPAKLALAAEVARAGEKIRRGLRMFAKGHRTLTSFYDELLEKAAKYFATWGELVFSIEPEGAAVDHVLVYTAERLEDNFFFAPYQDGIRQLTLLPGLPREEAEIFFETIERAAQGKEGAEDDFVTLLWEHELDHIGYVVIETFSESDEDEDREAQQRMDEVKGMINLAMAKDLQQTQARLTRTGARDPLKRQFTIRLTNADVHFLKAENLTVLDEVPPVPRDDELGQLYAVDPAALRGLSEEVKGDPYTLEKYLDALVRSLLPGGAARDLAAIVKLGGQIVEAVAAAKSFARAAEIIKIIRPLLPTDEAGEVTITRALLETLASDKLCDGVIGAVANETDEAIVAEAGKLAAALPREAVTKLVARLHQIPDRKRRRALCDTLAAFGQAALEAASRALPSVDEETALDLLYLVKKVGGTRAADLLDGTTRHPAPRVRFEALRYYLQVCDGDAAYRRARSALRDDDPAVRRTALEHLLQEVRTVAAANLVRELIEAEEFSKREFGEKRRIFLAYASLEGARAIPFFRERLGRRNLLARGEPEDERAAAAAALGLLHDDESRPALARLAGSMLTRSVVKHECEQALAALDRPAPVVAQAPAPAFIPVPVAAPAPAPAPLPPLRLPVSSQTLAPIEPVREGDGVIDRPATVRVDMSLRRTTSPPPAPSPPAPPPAAAPPRSDLDDLLRGYLDDDDE